MNQKLTDELNEVIRLITIEKKLVKATITRVEVDFVKELADKKRYPRAEYVLARMYLCGYQIEQNRPLGMKYLERSSRHASYDIQFKIAYIYYIFAEYGKLRECLSKAMDDCSYLND